MVWYILPQKTEVMDYLIFNTSIREKAKQQQGRTIRTILDGACSRNELHQGATTGAPFEKKRIKKKKRRKTNHKVINHHTNQYNI